MGKFTFCCPFPSPASFIVSFGRITHLMVLKKNGGSRLPHLPPPPPRLCPCYWHEEVKSYSCCYSKININIRFNLIGTLPYSKPGSSFAFSVTWQNGASTTIWTGQCLVCNGKETLETSWLLRSFVVSCIDKWKSTCIGRFYVILIFHSRLDYGF